MKLIGILSATSFCVCCLSILSAKGNAQKISFPGVSAVTKSPNDRYPIRNDDSEKQDSAHLLILSERGSSNKTTIHSYGRHVDLLWSPASDGFIINDYEASRSTRPLLSGLPWTGQKADLLQELNNFLRKRAEQRVISGNDHVYFVVVSWINPKELLCKLSGYGAASPNGFTKRYIYKLGQGFQSYR